MAVTPSRNRLLAAGIVYRLLGGLLFRSCRIRWDGPGAVETRQRMAAGRPFVAAFWHYGVILFPWLCRGSRWAAMVSASGDGAYIAHLLESAGVVTVRGSRNRASTRALKSFIGLMEQGYSAAIVADGSQGPARQAQPGAVLLAAHGRCPIIPMNWSASRYWVFNSWDRTILPKPFARIHLCFGEPIHVPERPDRRTLEQYRLHLEESLEACYRQAWSRVGHRQHAGEE